MAKSSGRSPATRKQRLRTEIGIKYDEKRLESIHNDVNADDTSKMETSPSRHLGYKRRPKDITQSLRKNISGPPTTRGIPNPHQLNSLYSVGQSKDRLERHKRSRAKKVKDEMPQVCEVCRVDRRHKVNGY